MKVTMTLNWKRPNKVRIQNLSRHSLPKRLSGRVDMQTNLFFRRLWVLVQKLLCGLGELQRNVMKMNTRTSWRVSTTGD